MTSYQWNTAGCYRHPSFNNGNPGCFPLGRITQNVTGNDLLPKDAGTITCSVIIDSVNYTSESFTIRISGEQLLHCVITCIVYYKHCTLLLLATYMLLLYYATFVMVIMHRFVFTVGIAVTRTELRNNAIIADNALRNYSYVNARDSGVASAVQIARCVTGLGPSTTENNSALGGVYFNGSRLAFETCMDSSPRLVHPRAANLNNLGVLNLIQCRTPFTIALEGIYTCTMMNSSMMEQSVRFGVYFNARSESLRLYMPLLKKSFISLHSCSKDKHSTIIYCNGCFWFFPHIKLYLIRFSPRHIYMEEG